MNLLTAMRRVVVFSEFRSVPVACIGRCVKSRHNHQDMGHSMRFFVARSRQSWAANTRRTKKRSTAYSINFPLFQSIGCVLFLQSSQMRERDSIECGSACWRTESVESYTYHDALPETESNSYKFQPACITHILWCIIIIILSVPAPSEPPKKPFSFFLFCPEITRLVAVTLFILYL